MRLIDADRLLSDRMKSKYYKLPNGDTAIPIIDIEHAPTVEQPEQKHGHWKAENDFYDGDYYYTCSVCGDAWFLESGDPKDNNMHYCPCCGAKLDEEVNPCESPTTPTKT